MAWSLFCAAAGGSTAPIKIELHADTVYAINGVTEIRSAVFGVTAYEGAPWPAMPEYRDVLAGSGIACLGFPQHGFDVPEHPPQTVADIFAWFESDAALNSITSGILHGNRYLYGRILPACRDLGIEPMMYLFGTQWAAPQFPETDEQIERYGAGFAAVLAMYKRVDPDLRLVHILNEPNAYFYKHGKGGRDYARMFKAAATAIKKRFPEVMVGGAVNCWPPTWPPMQTNHANWYQWDSYTMPLIRTAGETLDFFDYHYYGLNQQVAAEEVLTIANAMFLHRGRRIPVAITECGNTMSNEDAADPTTHYMTRTLGMQRIIMTYLDRPATVLTMQMHDLHANAGGAFKFVRSTDPENQLPTYYMYRLWRHFRGSRLAATSPDPRVSVMATLNEGTAVCMVFNDQDETRHIEVAVRGLPPEAAVETPPRWESLHLDKKHNTVVRSAGIGNRLRAPPFSTHAVRFALTKDFKPHQRAERLERFGNAVMSEFERVGQTLQINVDVGAEDIAAARSARIRIGLLGSTPDDRITMTVAGGTYTLNNATDDTRVGFQEIPLDQMVTAGPNALKFTLHGRAGVLGERLKENDHENRLRISAVSLVLEK